MSEEKKQAQNGISRRKFLKIGAAAGIATQAVAIPALAYGNGKTHDSYLGWESFEGTLNSLTGSHTSFRGELTK